MSKGIAFLDACDVAERIKSKDVSAVEVTEVAIRRAEALQPELNAFISLEAEAALEAALRIDQRLAAGDALGSLAGVPLAHKDMYYREGKVTTCGSRIRADFVADRTSTALTRLDEAGERAVRHLAFDMEPADFDAAIEDLAPRGNME